MLIKKLGKLQKYKNPRNPIKLTIKKEVILRFLTSFLSSISLVIVIETH